MAEQQIPAVDNQFIALAPRAAAGKKSALAFELGKQPREIREEVQSDASMRCVNWLLEDVVSRADKPHD